MIRLVVKAIQRRVAAVPTGRRSARPSFANPGSVTTSWTKWSALAFSGMCG
jgi:hypothetical protein